MTISNQAPEFDSLEWDEDKRRLNMTRHEIDFRDVAVMFGGPVYVTRSDRKGEMRWLAVGAVEGKAISVVFTQREKVRRIISARPARRSERASYRALYAGRGSGAA